MFNIKNEEILNDYLGEFNGEAMVSQNGSIFPVPPNYASKSGLVEGDVLRMIIKNDGDFVFKQIKMMDRKSLIGTVEFEGTDAYVATDEGRFKIIHASITFMKAQEGDKAIIMVPKYSEATFGSLKAIIKKGGVK
jgi:hypothetical protein